MCPNPISNRAQLALPKNGNLNVLLEKQHYHFIINLLDCGGIKSDFLDGTLTVFLDEYPIVEASFGLNTQSICSCITNTM